MEPYLPVKFDNEFTLAAEAAIKYTKQLSDTVRILRLAQESLRYAHWWGNVLTGGIIFSPELQEMFGEDINYISGNIEHPLLGEYVISHIHPDDIEVMAAQWNKCAEAWQIKDKDLKYKFKYRIKRSSGSLVYTECILTWYDFDSAILFGITRDISEYDRW